jgi:hypothetical protein
VKNFGWEDAISRKEREKEEEEEEGKERTVDGVLNFTKL